MAVQYCTNILFFENTIQTQKPIVQTRAIHMWSGEALPVCYYSGMATIMNTWRGIGVHGKVLRNATERVGAKAAIRMVGKKASVTNRGRWGSLDKGETQIRDAMSILGPLFTDIFPETDARKRKRQSLNPGDAEQDQYAADQKNYRKTSTNLANNAFCLTMVLVSHIFKKPVMGFFTWYQKQVGERNVNLSISAATTVAHLGPTPLSLTISYKV